MHVQVNGEIHQLRDQLRLSDLIKEHGLAPERIAIELNRQVVRRAEWEHTTLKENDRVEIVHFVGGGCKLGRLSTLSL